MKLKGVYLFVLLALPFAAAAASPVAHCDPGFKLTSPPAKLMGPAIFVGRDGVQLLKPARLKQDAVGSLEAMRSTLLKLTPDDWPQGCFVVVFLPGIQSGNDPELIKRNLQELGKMLNEIGVQVRMVMSAKYAVPSAMRIQPRQA